jgi:hypothetical protein
MHWHQSCIDQIAKTFELITNTLLMGKFNFKLLIRTGLVLFLTIPLVGFFILRNLKHEKPIDETRTVYIQKTEYGYQLIRNGEPFYIQGAGGESYFKELAAIGGNTIRLFDTRNLKSKLDEAYKYNLAAIVDIYLPKYKTSYYSYDDDNENKILKQEIRDLVDEHKDHPALLIWNLGNEINYPVVFWKNDFIRTFNELVSIIHEVDPNHPVSTSIIGVGRKTISSIFIHSPELDLISFNSFGNTIFVNTHLAQVSFLFGSRPYFYSELGPDGPWESAYTTWNAPIEATSTRKAELFRERVQITRDVNDGSGLGSLMFYWGSKLERTHTWFSLFKEGYKSENIKVIENLWKPTVSRTNVNTIGNLLAIPQDSRILARGELHQSGKSSNSVGLVNLGNVGYSHSTAGGDLHQSGKSSNSIDLERKPVNIDGQHYENTSLLRNSSQWDNPPSLIGLDYMLLNNRGAHENIIFTPDELHQAEVYFDENYNENVRIKWEIYPEAWFSDTSAVAVKNYKPIDSFVSFEVNEATFRAPKTEGPYRIFVYVYDEEGYFATANIPFYVLRNK